MTIDAAVYLQSPYNALYFFKGREYIKFQNNIRVSGYPNDISSWQVPNNWNKIDAVVVNYDDSTTYVFNDDKYVIDNGPQGVTLPITSKWNLPSSWNSSIDAAVYLQSPYNALYFFKGTEYIKFQNNIRVPGYPINAYYNWGMPNNWNNIDAVVVNYDDNTIYIFNGDQYVISIANNQGVKTILPIRSKWSLPSDWTIISTASPTCSPTSVCLNLNLKSLHLGSVGDLDRNNEEIEIHIKSGIEELDCGLYLFDMLRQTQDQTLNISIPCINDEFVKVRFYERDNCNDDTRLESIKCALTNGLQNLEVAISSDNTETSYTKCRSSSNTGTACVDASVGTVVQVGGSYCNEYTWGTEECGTNTVSETSSQYTLEYEVTNGTCCSQNTIKCTVGGQYYPGPICSNIPTATAVNVPTTTAANDAFAYDIDLLIMGSVLTVATIF